MNKLEEHINNSPLVRAAITEAVRRFYYDRVLSDKETDKKVLEELELCDLVSNLWNLTPNWQFVIENSTKRYSPNPPNTNAVSIHGKPKKIIPFTVTIEIK